MPGDAPHRDDLPVPDYDHLPLTGLAHRIRSLDESQIDALLAYERGHADRAAAVQILTARKQQLADGAEPSSGDAAGLAPELAPPPSEGSKVTPATAPAPDIPPTESDQAIPPMRG